MSGPTISVVIPCYNGAKFLRETLDSVLAQTYPVLEVLVIDDGSTDDSAAIAESYGPPVRVIRQPNQGESVARNRGMDEARGEWIAFLDADDLWFPEKLAHQAAAVTSGDRAVCTGNDVFGMDRNAPWSRFVPDPASFGSEWILEHGAPCHISGLMVHRSVSARFPVWTGDAEDVIYYLELVGQAKIKIVPLPLVLYRVHPRGQTSRPDMGERRDATLQKWLQLHLEGSPHTELVSLRRALLRRKKWAMLSQGHSQRQRGLLLKGLLTYSQVLWQSLYSPTSSAIVSSGLRSTLGAIRDSLRLRSRTLPS